METKDTKATGIKYDSGKPKMHLLQDFGLALREVAKVATFGAEKYSEGNWLLVDEGVKRYSSAQLRHYFSEKSEVYDSETGFLHATHTAWNALAKLELMLRQAQEAEIQATIENLMKR